jgi:regulator of protease activity HflC (stomatin/prohibitin superfamily)
MKLRNLAVLAVLAISTFITGCTTIKPGYVGIVVNQWGKNRGVQDYTPTTGFVGYNPISTTIETFPTSNQTIKWTADPKEGGLNDSESESADESITFVTNKGTAINSDVSLTFSFERDMIPNFYVQFRSDDIKSFAYGYLHNVTRNAMTEIGSRYSVEDVMGGKTEEYVKAVQDRIQEQLKPIGVVVGQFGFIGKLRPPQQIIDSINAAQQAQYYAQQKQNELAQAQADAAKQVAAAKGAADSEIARAQGQAAANKMINDSLTDKVLERTRLDIEWQRVQKWNGVLPQVTTGGGNGVLLNLPAGK